MGASYFIVTLGCPKNQADSREMERSLQERGYYPVETADEADLIIINSCAFIQAAREETIETIFEGADIKNRKPGSRLILAGCFSERYRDILDSEIPELDLHFGTGRYAETGSLIESLIGSSSHPVNEDLISLTRPYAPLKISEGCSRGCTFCAIPLFRGPYRDIHPDLIMEEARKLAADGVREVDIVSQDTISCGGGRPEALLDLVEQIGLIEGLEWIRLLYLYPDSKTEKLIREWGKRKPAKLVPYLESPIQHVSGPVLKAMGRSGSGQFYADLFLLARELIPDVEIRTSLILGFPGEGTSELDEIIEFINLVKPEKLALFPFSPEEGTPSQNMVPETTRIEERINIVRAEHDRILKEIQKSRIGKRVDCMIDLVGDDEIIGRRKQDAPEADGVVLLPLREGVTPGEIHSVRIDGFIDYDLTAEFAEESF